MRSIAGLHGHLFSLSNLRQSAKSVDYFGRFDEECDPRIAQMSQIENAFDFWASWPFVFVSQSASICEICGLLRAIRRGVRSADYADFTDKEFVRLLGFMDICFRFQICVNLRNLWIASGDSTRSAIRGLRRVHIESGVHAWFWKCAPD
jgi:hypothetical protein